MSWLYAMAAVVITGSRVRRASNPRITYGLNSSGEFREFIGGAGDEGYHVDFGRTDLDAIDWEIVPV